MVVVMINFMYQFDYLRQLKSILFLGESVRVSREKIKIQINKLSKEGSPSPMWQAFSNSFRAHSLSPMLRHPSSPAFEHWLSRISGFWTMDLKQMNSHVLLHQNGLIQEQQRLEIWDTWSNDKPHSSPEKPRREMFFYGLGKSCL